MSGPTSVFEGLLRMIFNAETTPLPKIALTPEFRLRTIADSELETYNDLRASVEFPRWEFSYLREFRNKVLPDSILVVEEIATGRLAASACAERTDFPEHPELGVLGWVINHPDFRGKRLGRSVSAAVMHRLYAVGYRNFSLLTQDFRLPALHVYLDMGWKPWLYKEDMRERWRMIAKNMGLKGEIPGCLPENPEFLPPRLTFR